MGGEREREVKGDVKVVGNLSGVAYPSRLMRRIQSQLGGSSVLPVKTVDAMLQDAAMVKGVQNAMERAMTSAQKPDGSVDMHEAALHLIRLMRENQKP